MAEIFEQVNQAADQILEHAAPSRDHLKDIGFDPQRIERFRETWKETVRGLGINAGLALTEIAVGFGSKELLREIGGRLSMIAYRLEIPARGAQDSLLNMLPFLQQAPGRISTVQSLTVDALSSAAYVAGEAALVAGIGFAVWKHGRPLIIHGLDLIQLTREQNTRKDITVAAEGKSSINVALLGREAPEQLESGAAKRMLPPKG